MMQQIFSINLEYYKNFYYVAKHGTVTAAAEKLCLSQPSVTSTIQRLEEQLGCTLFLRTKRGMTLTAEGKVLWNRVEPACQLLLMAEQELAAMRQLSGGTLSIASTEMSFRTYVLPAIERFTQDYPDIKVRFHNAPLTDTILNLLCNGEIDMAVLHSPFPAGDRLHLHPLGTIEECFVTGPKFAFLSDKPRTLAELQGYPFLSVPEGASTKQYASDIFQNCGLVYEPDIEVATIELLLHAVKHNFGIAILPWQRVWEDVEQSKLFRIPVTIPPMVRTAFAVTHNDIPLCPAAQIFLDQYLLPESG